MSARISKLRAARSAMEAVRAEIYLAAEGRSEAELLTPPKSGGWCAAEVLDHIRTAEAQVVKALGKQDRGEPVRIPKRAWFYRIPMALAFPPIRIPAPKPVRPRAARDIKPAEVLEGLKTSRRDLLAFADRLGEERFASLIFPHFILGRFSGLSWFRFIGKHENRHLGQLKRVLAEIS
jgi:hypothetical protein